MSVRNYGAAPLSGDFYEGRAKALIVTMAGGERFFFGFNAKGHVQTAWTLAGARLFLDDPEAIEHPDFKKVKARLDKAGKAWRIVTVAIR